MAKAKKITKAQWRERMREIGSLSWSKAGKASAAALTPAQRSARARKAVLAREAKRKAKARAEA
ncbi:MAG: hypothetical protein ACKO0Z_01475 [Betaproteobacteria bacterium]